MSKNKFFRYSFILLMILCLTSCFNMKIDLNFDKKSGKMTMEYDINDEYFQLISIVMSNVQISENVFFDPFVLLDEASFKTFYDSLPKDNISAITLSSVSITRNEKTGYYKGKIVFAFKDFEKCMALIPAGVSGLEFTKDKNIYSFVNVEICFGYNLHFALFSFLSSKRNFPFPNKISIKISTTPIQTNESATLKTANLKSFISNISTT